MSPHSRSAAEFFTNCRIVDVQAGVITGRRTVRAVDGVVADTDAGSPPLGADAVDMRGMYVLPGLVSCHAHLQAQYPYSKRSEAELPQVTVLRAAYCAARTLEAGITTVRCVHEQSRADLAVRTGAAAGWLSAPRILAAGRALTVAGGHGHGLGCVVTSGKDGFRNAAAAELAAGADHVKIFLTGGLARSGERVGDLQMHPDEIAGAVAAAEAHGSYVVAHAASSHAIRAGLAVGVRSFEHGYELDAATAARLAAAGVFLTPTLVVTHASGWMSRQGFDSQAIARNEQAREQHEQSAGLAVAAGVRLVNGTDFPPADSIEDDCPMFVREAELLTEAGMTPLDSLRAATLTPADLLGLTGQVGTITPGAAADMVALPEDPLQSASALRGIQLVIKGGQVIRAGGPTG
jgi:imidazolonepropionase-like amidohydrolase